MTSKELTELIRQNTRIILPEFGAFLVKDSSEKEFNPSNVSFSPFLRYNDGMLEVHVAKSRGISKEEASKDIREFVETVKNELLEKGFFQIEGLGELRRDQRGKLSFTLMPIPESTPKPESTTAKSQNPKKKTKVESPAPEEKNDDSKDVWLEERKPIEETDLILKQSQRIGESKAKVEKLTVTRKVVKPPIIEEEPQQEPLKEVIPEQIKETKVEPKEEIINIPEPKIVNAPSPKLETKIIEKEPVINNKVGDKEKPSYIIEPVFHSKKRKRLVAFIYTAILIAVLVGLGFIIKNYYLPPNVEFTADSLSTLKPPVNILKNAVDAKGKIEKPKDDIDKTFNKLESTKKGKKIESTERLKKEEAQEEVIKNTIIKNAKKTSKNGTQYHVIAGSFKNPTFAENYIKEIKKLGYNPTIVIQPSGMNAVAVGSYNTKEEANEAIQKLKDKLPNLWVLKK